MVTFRKVGVLSELCFYWKRRQQWPAKSEVKIFGIHIRRNLRISGDSQPLKLKICKDRMRAISTAIIQVAGRAVASVRIVEETLSP